MKKWLVVVNPENSFMSELSVTALRVGAGLLLALLHGWKKIPPGDGFISGVTALGFPLPEAFAWMAALAEFGGGILLAFGLLTRPASVAIAFTMAVACFGAHAVDPLQKKELALIYLLIAVFFAVRGSGKLSVDKILS